MLSTFQHLSPQQLAQLAQLVQKIVQATNPDKIICYGSRITTMQDWSCFAQGTGCKEIAHPTYDLLIIPNSNEKRADHELIQIAEQQALPLGCAVTSVVQKLASVNSLLEKGARFFATLYRKGVLVYNGSGAALVTPPNEPDITTVKSRITDYWDKCFGMAQCFLKSASFCIDGGWHEQAVFNLHQSVQHTCMALLRVFTGFRSNTHNLARLLALVQHFSYAPMMVFPCITKEETDLFNTLNKAYSDARYNESYMVSVEKATILMERVSDFIAIAERLYQQRLLDLENGQSISFPLIPATYEEQVHSHQ
ncbi:HEPN domain-containing protein [Chitinophaga polysaccharea]|uniref:HEPN domain-containing protein n=1 Tax=Chitinophaga polysaccharea TaxID=1293035 RepID=UPI001158E038|nr:HEPN domain-containing protein [Chitinophaga polysaccharea]